MIKIIETKNCCGCAACVLRCPKQCITMHEDEEGFLYPHVDEVSCIDCGLCEKICPVINQDAECIPLHTYAAKNKNEAQRLRSSSGGIFVLLAEHIISEGGVVFGARFDANWEVEHGYAETWDELAPFMRSKYVQSRIGNTYQEAEAFLKAGRKVLFTGTSCQIAGLKKFLRKNYDNLLAVDVICHGVPSPGVWRRYLEEIKNSRNEIAGKKSVSSLSLKAMPMITDINFREKQLGGYSWKKYGFVVHRTSASKSTQNSVLLATMFNQDAFFQGFLSNIYLRPSCYACPAKAGKCGSDLTLGDFWGIGQIIPEIDDDRGVSAVMVHTHHVAALLVKLGVEYREVSFDRMLAGNPSYNHSVALKIDSRQRFYKAFFHGKSVMESLQKAFTTPLHYRIIIKVKRIIKRFI